MALQLALCLQPAAEGEEQEEEEEQEEGKGEEEEEGEKEEQEEEEEEQLIRYLSSSLCKQRQISKPTLTLALCLQPAA